MGTRAETLVGDDVTLGFRHFYNGILMNVDHFNHVTILDRMGQPVHTIPASEIVQLDVGTYQVLAPGSVFTEAGYYSDVWSFVPSAGASTRNLKFQINVVTVYRSQDPNLPNALSCNIADLTSCMLKTRYLWPVWSVLQNGYYLADDVLQHFIDVGITYMERRINQKLRHTRVLTKPYADYQTPPNPQLGTDYDEDGDLIQWSAIESHHWSTIRLPRTNIIKVTGVRGVYQGRTVYRIPLDWIEGNYLRNGFIRIRPTTTGTINTLVDNSGQFLDVTLLESIGNQFVPGFWAVDYEYGFKNGYLAKEICDAIMKKAAIGLLDQIGMSITKGLASKSASADGLSSSIGLVANAEKSLFGSLVTRYESDLQDLNLDDMKRKYKGPSVFIL